MKAFDRIAVRTEVLETISVYYKAIKENRVKDVVFYSESIWSTKSPDILQLPSGTGESYGVHTSYKNYIKDIVVKPVSTVTDICNTTVNNIKTTT